MKTFTAGAPAESRSSRLGRVLLADDNVATRLTLQVVLEAGGYAVDSAASAAEAVGKMDIDEYDLVLTDMDMESPSSGKRVLEHARYVQYKPAVAVITCETDEQSAKSSLVSTENLPELFGKVADLLSARAIGRLRATRCASA
jgi:CheY-like chemotaxis protein